MIDATASTLPSKDMQWSFYLAVGSILKLSVHTPPLFVSDQLLRRTIDRAISETLEAAA
jgi:hypothetical protein